MMSAPRPVSTPPGGGGESVALAGGDELLHGLAVSGVTGWKDPPIPRAQHDATAIAGELVGKILGMTDRLFLQQSFFRHPGQPKPSEIGCFEQSPDLRHPEILAGLQTGEA
jgi:hypothetical protein